ncbi:hypothetical protein [Streptomyces sp. NRRL F-5135]|uniref:hypothetical protein n=1 Tax=Streptomyces sp. NRRL F-5135 TaxID=1463858 RepID=UPI0018FE0D62|nr:hypothetical protein [Streptomyces sp. NRRL F-5135]
MDSPRPVPPEPRDRLRSARTKTTADAYATAAFAMGPAARNWLETLDGHEGMGVLPDGRSWRTRGFPGVVPAGPD